MKANKKPEALKFHKSNNPKIGVIIVNWNGKGHLKKCLRSLMESSYKNIDIIVVDNDSTDGSVELINRKFKRAVIIKNNRNLGFGTGCNIGARLAIERGAEHLFLINNDAIIQKNAISFLVNRIDSNQKEIGLVSPKIYFLKPKNMVWSAGGKFYWYRGSVIMRGFNKFDNKRYNVSDDITFATGCALLINGLMYKEIGLFDDRYFLYEEDVDYSLRTIQAGYRIVYEPKAIVFHKAQGSQKSRKTGEYISMSSPKNRRAFFFFYYLVRNKLLTMKKHGSKRHWLIFIPFFLIFCAKKTIGAVYYRNFKAVLGIIWGIIDYSRGLYGEKEGLTD